MRKLWSLILPLAGLLLFTVISYRSALVNDQTQKSSSKYYWWSSLRLDSDPLNQNLKPVNPCEDKKKDCANPEIANARIQPSWLDKMLIFSAFPAFLAGAATVVGLSKLGIDEVLTFMVSMPIFLFAWYYFVGWMIDRWLFKRTQTKSVPLKIS
jgi:hypothetical protein